MNGTLSDKKNFYRAKETGKKAKKYPTKWEMFANNRSDKGLKYIKNSYNSTRDNPIKKWAEDLTDTSPKKTYK